MGPCILIFGPEMRHWQPLSGIEVCWMEKEPVGNILGIESVLYKIIAVRALYIPVDTPKRGERGIRGGIMALYEAVVNWQFPS
jgi:hypothetical protein